MAKFALRRDNLAKRRKLAGIKSNGELARILDMDKGSISRVLRDDDPADPGVKFMAGLLLVFGTDSFDELFDVMP